jgi:hypothetical protein
MAFLTGKPFWRDEMEVQTFIDTLKGIKMALETLKDVEDIGGFEVKRVTWKQPDANFIEVNDEYNAITFKIQNGPIKEKGLNGVQVDQLIQTAKIMIEGLNKKFPCRENACAITKLDEALLWLLGRRINREARGVEGTSQT